MQAAKKIAHIEEHFNRRNGDISMSERESIQDSLADIRRRVDESKTTVDTMSGEFRTFKEDTGRRISNLENDKRDRQNNVVLWVAALGGVGSLIFGVIQALIK